MEQWKQVKERGHIHPDPNPVMVLPSPKRLRVLFGGEVLADSARALLLREKGHLPVYYVPREDVHMEHLQPTEHHTHCPRKGDASYFTLRAGGRTEENAAWSYETPLPGAESIAGHLAFYWERMDGWYEEDEEILVHPRDPFVRVDILDSTRRVRVTLGGEVVADSTHARFLFETGHPTRHYLPREDVRMDLLQPSDAHTRCPYKGEAHYWHASVGGQTYENVVWSYPQPVREAAPIAGYLCFYAERVDTVEVSPPDGALPKGAR
ncbi:MAG TPA: DUF427 domain-containing protein [bacterium]|nr:DUF427 domain-containing protein [bacterium]